MFGVNDSNTSGARATVYAFGATVVALVAFYVDAEAREIALWQALLAAAIPFGALVMATVRTWPKRKATNKDA
jgi:ABC-type uncharacterized transport system permease subunit